MANPSTPLLLLIIIASALINASARSIKGTIQGVADVGTATLHQQDQYNFQSIEAYLKETQNKVSLVQDMVKRVMNQTCDSFFVQTELQRKELNAIQQIRTYSEALSKIQISIQKFLGYQYSNKGKCQDKHSTCGGDFFPCLAGDCVHQNYACDGIPDCSDGSDEQYCTEITCPNDLYWCKTDKKCLPRAFICDGIVDCAGGIDEEDCQLSEIGCLPNQFHCQVEDICLPSAYLCDRKSDCADGSDELDCKETSTTAVPGIANLCADDKFACADGPSCISKSWQCDGDRDCTDGSDEANCQN
ncbi:hypothetical protein SK128_017449, partial [Halocaridina rubra]